MEGILIGRRLIDKFLYVRDPVRGLVRPFQTQVFHIACLLQNIPDHFCRSLRLSIFLKCADKIRKLPHFQAASSDPRDLVRHTADVKKAASRALCIAVDPAYRG